MSILALVASASGGLAVGTIVGGFTLVPRVGPWRGQRPAVPPVADQQQPTVLVVQPQPETSAVDRSVLEALTAGTSALPSAQLDLILRALGTRAVEQGADR